MNKKYTTRRYVISVVARKNWDIHSKSYALGFTGFDIDRMIPILCDYEDNDVWTFADIDTAKEFWDRYKDRLFERYGECIQKHNIYISEITVTVDKVEELGE